MRALWVGLLMLCTASAVQAQGLFQLNASSSTTSVKAGGSSVINLVDGLTNNSNQFAPLKNQTFSAGLNYAGIPNAIQFQQSFDANNNRVVTLKVPSTGLDKTFSAANGSLETQIKNFLKKDGLADLTAFQAVVGRESIAGVVDGNPLAATALLQDAGYQEFGLHQSPNELNGTQYTTDGGHTVSRYWVNGGVFDGGGSTGTYVDVTLATEFNFNDFVGLSFTTPLRFETIKSADVFMGGEIVGLPITILPAKGGHFSWQVTPAGQVALAGSQDFVSGGLLFGGQINSSFSYNLAGFTFTLADSAGYNHGADLDIDGYDFNTHVDQWLFKNGLQLQKNWGNFFADASGTWTNFLHSAFVSGYLTPEVGVGFRFGKNQDCGLRVGYAGNFGNNFNSNGGNVLLYFAN